MEVDDRYKGSVCGVSTYNHASVMSIRTARMVSQGWQSHCFSDEARVVAAMVMSLFTLGAIIVSEQRWHSGGYCTKLTSQPDNRSTIHSSNQLFRKTWPLFPLRWIIEAVITYANSSITQPSTTSLCYGVRRFCLQNVVEYTRVPPPLY